MFEVQEKQLSQHVKQKYKNSQFFDINLLFVLVCHLIGHGHSAAKRPTSVLNMI